MLEFTHSVNILIYIFDNFLTWSYRYTEINCNGSLIIANHDQSYEINWQIHLKKAVYFFLSANCSPDTYLTVDEIPMTSTCRTRSIKRFLLSTTFLFYVTTVKTNRRKGLFLTRFISLIVISRHLVVLLVL